MHTLPLNFTIKWKINQRLKEFSFHQHEIFRGIRSWGGRKRHFE